MIPGVNPRQMQKMMKQMGMKQDQVPASRVEIFLENGSKLVFPNPDVQKVVMMGQETYQLSGQAHEEAVDSTPDISEEDLETIMDQTGCSKEQALQALEDAEGDLAQAIMSLSE